MQRAARAEQHSDIQISLQTPLHHHCPWYKAKKNKKLQQKANLLAHIRQLTQTCTWLFPESAATWSLFPGLSVGFCCRRVRCVVQHLLSICIHLGRLEILSGNHATNRNCTSIRCCGHLVGRVLFVKENVTLFWILKQYYIDEINEYTRKRVLLKSVVSCFFVLCLNSVIQGRTIIFQIKKIQPTAAGMLCRTSVQSHCKYCSVTCKWNDSRFFYFPPNLRFSR